MQWISIVNGKESYRSYVMKIVDNLVMFKMKRKVSAQSFLQGKNRVEQISDCLLTGVVLKTG
jgi:hypothetical protein